jgi:DNA repair exonuclease SbcCD ATPase subunit
MIIEFEEMIIRGFMSFRDKQRVPFFNQGIVQIQGINKDEGGSNRAGKSAILEPLLWCLFGRTIRKIKGVAVVHRFAKKEGCYVETRFHTDSSSFRVRRYQSYPGHNNGPRLWIAGREQTHRHVDDTQNHIERCLGFDYATFSNSVVFGGPKPFASLTDAEQKEILESFLHFEQFDLALRHTKVRLSESINLLAIKRESRAGLSSTVKSSRESLKSIQDSSESYVSKQREAITAIQRKIRALDAQKQQKMPQKRLKRAEKLFSRATRRMHKAEAKYLYFRSRISELETRLNNKQELLKESNCPTCGQSIKKHSLESILEHYSGELKEAQHQKGSARRYLLKWEKEVKYARTRLKREQEKLDKTNRAISNQQNLRREMLHQIDNLEQQGTPFAEQIEELSQKYSTSMTKLLRLEQEIRKVNRKVKDLEFWVRGFGNQGVKALIIRKALPAMNAKLVEYSREVFNGAAELRFNPTKETKSGNERELFHISYKARRGADSYMAASSGEKKRIDICVLLTFSWLAKLSNILLVDELLDGLDDAGKTIVLEILSTLRGTILVISHSKELKSRIGKVWTVTKYHGRSKLSIAA